MKKGTKVIFVLIGLVLIIGCSGCDQDENMALDDEMTRTLLYNPQGWVAQEHYKIRGTLVATLTISEVSVEFTTVVLRSNLGAQIDSGRLLNTEEGYIIKCDFGTCSVKLSTNASLDDVVLTLTNQKGDKYYFSLESDT